MTTTKLIHIHVLGPRKISLFTSNAHFSDPSVSLFLFRRSSEGFNHSYFYLYLKQSHFMSCWMSIPPGRHKHRIPTVPLSLSRRTGAILAVTPQPQSPCQAQSGQLNSIPSIPSSSLLSSSSLIPLVLIQPSSLISPLLVPPSQYSRYLVRTLNSSFIILSILV